MTSETGQLGADGVQALREARERTLAIMASVSGEEIFAGTRIARDLWL